MKLHFFVFLPWLLLALPAWSAPAEVFKYPLARDNSAAFTELAAAMQHQTLIKGEFTQTKHLQMLERPLVTTGTFTLSPDAFEWRIQHPFSLSYRFANQRLTREVDGVQQRVAPASEPALFGFFSFFTSLFSLSQDSLEKLFQVFFLASPDGWELGLVPEQPQLAASVQHLHIRGSDTLIDQVRLTEVGGDFTEIRFDYSQQAPSPQ